MIWTGYVPVVLPGGGFLATPAAAMRCVCSWCKAVLRAGEPGGLTTHSICPACLAKQNAELDRLCPLPPVAV